MILDNNMFSVTAPIHTYQLCGEEGGQIEFHDCHFL